MEVIEPKCKTCCKMRRRTSIVRFCLLKMDVIGKACAGFLRRKFPWSCTGFAVHHPATVVKRAPLCEVTCVQKLHDKHVLSCLMYSKNGS